jgi:dihydroorotase
MTKNILIKNGRIVDPSQGIDELGSLIIENGKVYRFKAGDKTLADCNTINAAGKVVCPGFIDLHCHLREPGFEEKETIATGGQAAAKGGFTTICCMPNTEPPLDTQASIDYVKRAAKESPVRILPIGCISYGRKGQELAEMGELAQAGVAGYSDDGDPVADSSLLLKAMEYSLNFGLPIIEHCEDKSLSAAGQMNEGITATRLGLKGIPAAAEEVMVARDIALAETSGASLHIAHVSTAGSVELIRAAKEKGVKVTAEVTPHHLTLTEEALLGYDTNAKVSPPLRTNKDIEALVAGLKDDTINAIATDHAPHTAAEKNCEFAFAPFGISGFETALGALMGLVHTGKLDLPLLISKLTAEPAAIINKDSGSLKEGATADITIIDIAKKWQVKTDKFLSKGKNTPLQGKTLKGKVTATIVGGEIVYEDED